MSKNFAEKKTAKLHLGFINVRLYVLDGVFFFLVKNVVFTVSYEHVNIDRILDDYKLSVLSDNLPLPIALFLIKKK